MQTISGQIYKQIRLNKKLSQLDVCGNFISRTTLSRFENDRVTISVKNFEFLLQQIDMSFDEFSFITNKYQMTEKNAIIDLFFTLQSNLDTKKIKNIIQQCQNFLSLKHNWYIECIYKIMISQLSLENSSPNVNDFLLNNFVDDIWKKLAAQDDWYLIDFRIVNYILFYFPTDVAIEIGIEVLERIKKYQNFQDIIPLTISLNLNMALLTLQNHNLYLSEKYSATALELSKRSKRYDFLMIAYIRHGLATKNQAEIKKGQQLAEIVDESKLLEGLLLEIDSFN